MSFRKYTNQRGTADRNTRNGRIETPDKFTMFGNIENPTISTNLRDQERGDGFSPNDVYKMRYDYAMWQQQNDYNEDIYNRYQSPKALMDQYQQAGINPMLVAGGSMPQGSLGSDSAPDSSGVGDYQSQPASSRFSQVLGVIASLFGVGSQISNAITSSKTRRQNQQFQQQELDLKGQQTAAQVAKTNEETKGLEIENRYKSLEKSLDIAFKAGQISKQEKENALLDFNVQVNKNVTPELAAQNILTKYQLDKASVSKTEAEIDYIDAVTALTKANTRKVSAETRMVLSSLQPILLNYRDEHDLAVIQKQLQSLQLRDKSIDLHFKSIAKKYNLPSDNLAALALASYADTLEESDRRLVLRQLRSSALSNSSDAHGLSAIIDGFVYYLRKNNRKNQF